MGATMRRLSLLSVAALFAAVCGASAEGNYPDRPIKLIVPQAPGSATDNVARVLAAALTKELGETMYVENGPGGAFVIGNDAVAKSPPDGYTLGIGNIGGMGISPNLVAKL